MYMFCSKVVEEPSVGTDCSFSLAYRSLLRPRILPWLFQEVSKTEGGVEDESSMMYTRKKVVIGQRGRLGEWKRSLRNSHQGGNLVHSKWFQSTPLFFKERDGSPMVNVIGVIYERKKKKVRKKNKLEINNNISTEFFFSELPRAESIQPFILYFIESKTLDVRCTTILSSAQKKHASSYILINIRILILSFLKWPLNISYITMVLFFSTRLNIRYITMLLCFCAYGKNSSFDSKHSFNFSKRFWTPVIFNTRSSNRAPDSVG